MKKLRKFYDTCRFRGLRHALRTSISVLRNKSMPEERYHGLCENIREASVTNCNGILHIGANDGAEATTYAAADKQVVWVEALPAPFVALQGKIAAIPKQRAIQATIGAVSGEKVTFYVSADGGQQSSLLAPSDKMKSYFPGVRFTGKFETTTVTVSDLYAAERLANFRLDHLVLDVQGAELSVLRGFNEVLADFRSLEVEYSTIELYKGGAQLPALVDFLEGLGFRCVLAPPSELAHGVCFWENPQRSKYYGRFGEDRWIVEDVYGPDFSGYFVDVGAFDGKVLSNTLSLERHHGWRGLCIEPGPENSSLRENRNCIVSAACVGGTESEGHFYGVDDYDRRKWNRYPRPIEIRRKLTTLTSLLERHGCPSSIDYLSLDCGGRELEALQGLDFSRFGVKAMSIEHNYETNSRSEIETYLRTHRFTLVRKFTSSDCYLHESMVKE